MKAADLFVKALEAEGVNYVFGIPGEETLDLLDSLKNSPIELVLTRHEQAAGFMAATVGRLTGKAGVCLSTLGPGATNFVTPAAYAQLGGMPMVMITGQKPIKSSKQGHFQIVEVVDMMGPLTKYTKQIVSGDSIASRVREAFRLAEEERPGATHLELPEDIAADATTAKPLNSSYVRRPTAEAKAISHAVQMIESAKHPLLLVGAGSNRKLTSKMLHHFVDQTGIPFFTTQMGKGVIDDRHPLCLGCAALSDGDFVHRAIAKADLILNVGHDVVEKPPFFMRDDDPMKVIHINFKPASVDAVYFPQLEVVGDIANSIWQIQQLLKNQAGWDFSYFSKVREHLEAHIRKDADSERFPLIPQRIVRDVREAVPSDGILCLDNGMYKLWFARSYKAHQPNTILLDNALASMGAGLPSAIAAKLVFPSRAVVAIAGDGGFMMNSQELETAMRLKLNLVVIILRDEHYAMVQWKQRNRNLPEFGLAFGNPDFVKYAEAYGARGHRLENADLVGLLKECLATAGVHVIDVPVDYSDNEHIMSREIKQLSAAI